MSGQMRHRMDVFTESSDDGSDDPSFTIWRRNVPCNIVPVSGMETYRGKKLEATISHVVETRWFSGFLPTMKITSRQNSGTLQIVSVIERDGRRQYMDLFATEVIV